MASNGTYVSVWHDLLLLCVDIGSNNTVIVTVECPFVRTGDASSSFPVKMSSNYQTKKVWIKLWDISRTLYDEKNIEYPFLPFFSVPCGLKPVVR